MAEAQPVVSLDLALSAILGRITDTNDLVKNLDRKFENLRDSTSVRFDAVDQEIATLKADEANIKLEEQKGKLPAWMTDVAKGIVTIFLAAVCSYVLLHK